jgi:hypothetical protein
LVIEAGPWSKRRQIALPREALATVRWEGNVLTIGLTVREILDAPKIEPSEPNFFGEEVVLRRYFSGLPFGRRCRSSDEAKTISRGTEGVSLHGCDQTTTKANRRPHFHSALRCINYQIATNTGGQGHLDDILIDAIDWYIRFIVIDTQTQRANDRVIVTPTWVSEISSEVETVYVDQTQETIRGCPPLDQSVLATNGIYSSLYRKIRSPQRSDWDEDVVAGAPRLDQLRLRRFDAVNQRGIS